MSRQVWVGVALTAWCIAGVHPCLAAGMQGSEGAPAGGRRNAPLPRPLESVLQRMSKDLGAAVMADSSLARAQASLPGSPTTKDNIEDQLDALVKELPKGTVWAKVMLPAPKGKSYRPDDVLEFLLAQARLFGNVGVSKEGMVEVLGQRFENAKAEPVVSTLGLRPVYLLANPSARAGRSAETGDGDARTEGTVDSMVQGMKSLMNMNPEQRGQAMQQLFRSMGEMMQSMSPEQRRDFFSGMMRGGGFGGPGGFPGAPGGGRPIP
ncbi:MAG: hypothetical protein ACKO5K_14180 [Armatimonadota bacterium]